MLGGCGELNYLGVFGQADLEYIMTHAAKDARKEESSERRLAGSGANIARLASSLGVKTAFAGFVGINFPKEFEKELKKAGVDIKDLKKVKGYLSPTCRIIFDLNGKQVTTIDDEFIKGPGEIGLGDYTIKSSEVVHITRGIPKYYKLVIDSARALGRKVAFDPSEEIFYGYDSDSFEYMIKRTNYFFATTKECDQALELLYMKDPEDLLVFADAVIIVDDEQRAVYAKKDKLVLPVEKNHVDTKHAGDAFRAGFYAGLSRGIAIKDSAEIGNYLANLPTKEREPVTSVPPWDEVIEACGYVDKRKNKARV